MQVIKRKTESEIRHLDFKYFGYNSNGVFTLLMKDTEEEAEYLVNICGNDFRKLVNFIKSIK